MALSEKKHHTSRGQRKDRAGGVGSRRTTRQVPGAPTPSRSSSSCLKKSPAVPGHPVWVSRGGHRRRSSSAPLSSSPTSYPWCRFWTLLGCWEGVPSVEQAIAVPMISLDRVRQRSAVRRPQKAEQLVEVPTEPGYSLAVVAVQFLERRQRHWRSRWLTFQSLWVGGEVAEVFMVQEQDRVQQRPHPVVRILTLMKDFKGFCALFPGPKKVRRLSASRLIRAERSSNGSCRGV